MTSHPSFCAHETSPSANRNRVWLRKRHYYRWTSEPAAPTDLLGRGIASQRVPLVLHGVRIADARRPHDVAGR